MPKVSLIEGEGYLYDQDKLNCLDIILNEKVGTSAIVNKRIEIFESNCLNLKVTKTYPERTIIPHVVGEDIDMKLFEGAVFIDDDPNIVIQEGLVLLVFIIHQMKMLGIWKVLMEKIDIN